MLKNWKLIPFLGLLIVGLCWLFLASGKVNAQEGTNQIKEEVDDLNSSVKGKRDRIKEIDNLIGNYRERIKEQESEQATLANEVLLLENRIREKELSVMRTKEEIEVITLDIKTLQESIEKHQERIDAQKNIIAELIRRIHQSDEISTLDVLLTNGSLSSFFDHVERIKRIEKGLGSTINKVKSEKESIEESRRLQDVHKENLVAEEENLKKEQIVLASQKDYKTALIDETAESQEEFQRIIYELRQQQEQTSDDIARLETQLREKLDSIDDALARGDILLNWPVDPSRGITATFHDPDYPFRHLFEHSGTDIRASQGTNIQAPAGGYVAWHKTGRLYGNYMMIIHPGGIATVYAHLSKFIAPAESYVDRGQVIAQSGGTPGAQGAGLSTGPHLHFEVRQNGIPVNPENFLPSVR